MSVFKSDRYFAIYDYYVSHGQLLLRSAKSDDHPANIDIIFFGVKYLQTVTGLWGLNINKFSNSNPPSAYPPEVLSLQHENYDLFEIESGNQQFYIVASFFNVFENNLEPLESSLGMRADSERGKLIFTTTEI